MEIMKLMPVGKDYLWGGTRLKSLYGKNIDLSPLAETWECSVHPDGASLIVSGKHKGMSLKSVIEQNPEYLGENNSEGFPVLVKLIDAEKDLSVQVHPDDDYALIHENQKGKNEMWYVLEAEEDSSLVYGFKDFFSRETIKKAVADGNIMDYLNKVPVKKGDVFFIPSGTVHAIGAGIVIAEIQQNSNVTYRVYDYDRVDSQGRKRELHIDKALDVMKIQPAPAQENYSVTFTENGSSERILCSCRYFETKKIDVKEYYSLENDNRSFQILLCTEGKGTLKYCGSETDFVSGDCIFISAGTGICTIYGNTSVLKVKC